MLLFKSSTIVLALFLLSLTGSALAQKNEIAFLAGQTYNSNQGIRPNGGFSTTDLSFKKASAYEVTYARKFFDAKLFSLYLEVPFVASPKILLDATSGGNPALDYSSLYITPGVRAKLPGIWRLSPWVSAGYGYARFTNSSARLDGTLNTSTGSKNSGALQLGGGLDFRIFKRIGVRGEVRDFYTTVPPLSVSQLQSSAHGLIYSVGVVLHF